MSQTIPAHLFRHASERPEAPALWTRGPQGWLATSWAAYAQQVSRFARALWQSGFAEGDRICILGGNRREWVVAAVGCMAAGGVPAGIYLTCSAEEVAYIVAHSEAPIVVVEGPAQLRTLVQAWASCPQLRRVVVMGERPADADARVVGWEDFLREGEARPEAQVVEAVDRLQPQAPATFIYTSGTTGPPKAVMLSHHNLSWTCDLAVQLVTMGPQDLSLSYLPLSHIAEQMFSIHAPLRVGSQVYFFSDAPEKLRDYLGEVQPTVFFGVPRVWEKMHAALSARIGQATGARAKLAAWALSVGRRCGALRCRGELPSGWLALQEKLAERLVLAKVRAAIGFSRTHTAVSGAAPVSAEVLEFFSSLGLYISEVYGQSEDCGPTTFNRKGAIRYGTVGQCIPGVEVELAPDGEVLVRGPNVFLGYFKDPAATALALQDGWLCSGDLGAFDEDGYLRIIGRKKEILITSGGKNIAPVNIESALKDLPLVGQAVVIGDRRHYLTAVLSLDPEALREFAEKRGLSGLEPAAQREHPLLRAELDRGLEEVNSRFARVEHVRKYAVLPRELSVEGGELTPTLKVKRRKVDENWRDIIEAMYAGPAP